MTKLNKKMLEEMILSELETPVPNVDNAVRSILQTKVDQQKQQAKKDPTKKEIDLTKQVAVDRKTLEDLKKYASKLNNFKSAPMDQTQINLEALLTQIGKLAIPAPPSALTTTTTTTKTGV
jgi:hypothetical protein